MAKLMLEALDVTGDWVKGIKNETIITLATAIAMMALDSDEDKIPKILETFIETLKKFRTNEANALAIKIQDEVENEWAPPPSHYEHSALMM